MEGAGFESAGEGSGAGSLRVSDHVLLRCIGTGASGEVWLGRGITGVLRAVKVVRRDRFEHSRAYEREFEGLKRFEPVSRKHEGVVDVLQVGRDDGVGYFYYVMELADDAGSSDGRAAGDGAGYRPLTLAERLRQRGRLPVRECARIGAQVAEAMGFLHAQGLVHRDVKPSNIIFVGGRPKLADIGLLTGLGEARSFVGTDGYIPPEGPGSTRADLYSLGKVLYEMVTARSRFEYPDLPDDFSVGETEEFTELNETILKACASEPEERHGSAEELRGELLLVDAGRSVRRFRRNERLLGFWRRLGLGALVVAVVVAGGWWAQQRRTELAQRRAESETRLRRSLEEKELRARCNLYAADMNLAQQAMDDGNYGRAEALLSANLPGPGQEDLRGIEWYHFRQRVGGDSAGVLRGHEQVVSSLAWGPGGDRLYSASFDTTVREWSVGEMRELRRWTEPGSLFMAMALDPGRGRLALEGGNRPMSSILDLGDGRWTTHAGSASPTVLWLPDGRHLLRGADMLLFATNGVLELVDDRFRRVRRFEGTGGRAVMRPGGELLATGPWGDAIRFWGWPGMEPRGGAEGVGTVMAMAFSPDGGDLMSVTRDGRLRRTGAEAGVRLAERVGHGGSVIWTVAYSPDGTRIATGGNDQTVVTWDARTLEPLHVYRGHGSEVWAVSWSPDGRRLVSAGKDATIRFWDATPRPGPPEVADVGQAPAFSPDERWFVTRLRGSPGCRLHATAGGDPGLAMPDVVEVGGFSADGEVLSVLTSGARVEWRSVEGGRVEESRPVVADPGGWERRLLSRDGRWLVWGFRSGEIRIQDVRGEPGPFSLTGHAAMIVSLAISPEGGRLLSGSVDRTARLWDIRARRLLSELGGHGGGVQGVAFAPGGRTLVVTGASQLKFWSLAAEREAGVVSLPPGDRQGWVAVSPQGRWIGVVNMTGSLGLLSAPR